MANSDLLLALVRAGSRGDPTLFRRTVEAIAAEERAKQHHVLAEKLLAQIDQEKQPAQLKTSHSPDVQVQGFFYEITPRRTLDELILPAVALSACKEVVEEQLRSDLLRSHGLEPRHRILIAGPPGNGKTTLAEALAEALVVPMYVVRYDAIIGSYLGETALRLRRLFEYICSQRCLLFFDEFDALGKERGDVHETGEIKRVVSSLILQIDAIPSYVTIVTATNHPELLDRATWRRFQIRLNLPNPTQVQISEWLRRFEKDLGENLKPGVLELSRRLKGASFAEVEEFGLDILRRRILSGSETSLGEIVCERLKQWKVRLRPDTNTEIE